jgi:hypothetical protein
MDLGNQGGLVLSQTLLLEATGRVTEVDLERLPRAGRVLAVERGCLAAEATALPAVVQGWGWLCQRVQR